MGRGTSKVGNGSGGGGGGNTGKQTPEAYIESWKEQEVKDVKNEIQSWYDKDQKWKETETFRDRVALERNIPTVYQQVVSRNFATDEARDKAFEKVAKEITEGHFEALKSKVESKVGKITKITNLGRANDYDITGSNGNTVRIQVVKAGGYNKQRLHTRWTLHNIKKK